MRSHHGNAERYTDILFKFYLPICRSADIGNVVTSLKCRTDLPIYYLTALSNLTDNGNAVTSLKCRADIPIYCSTSLSNLTADMPMCRYRQCGHISEMPNRYTNILSFNFRYADLPISARRSHLWYAELIYRYIMFKFSGQLNCRSANFGNAVISLKCRADIPMCRYRQCGHISEMTNRYTDILFKF